MNRLLGLLGLCARSGRLITGEKAVIDKVRAGGARAVVLDRGASENAVKAVSRVCETHGTPLVWAEPFALGDAIGKPGRMAAAVTDAGLAERLLELSREGQQAD